MDVRQELYTGGRWVQPAGEGDIDVIDSRTEETMGRVPRGGPADVERAVAAARAAFPAWSQTSVAERITAIRALADGLEARGEQLAEMMSREVGTPIAISRRVNGSSSAAWRSGEASGEHATCANPIRATRVAPTSVQNNNLRARSKASPAVAPSGPFAERIPLSRMRFGSARDIPRGHSQSPIKDACVTPDTNGEAAEALWYVGDGQAEIRAERLAAPAAGEVRVRALYSAISRGTERLVAAGAIPQSEYAIMRAPFMGGHFPFPVKYGYAIVGRVEAGPQDLEDRLVFSLHPHQTLFFVPRDAVRPVPEGVPPPRAVLAANMETALNAVWDAAPGPADRIAIVGAGVVGALVARLCARLPSAHVTIVDIAPHRAALAHRLGVHFAAPAAAPHDCDVVFHASGTSQGLATALALAGDEARVLELSWVASHPVTVPLGAAFHSRRLRLVSSQVGQVSATHRPRWTRQRRLDAALALLTDEACDALLEPPIAWRHLPAQLPSILTPASGGLCQVIGYPSGPS